MSDTMTILFMLLIPVILGIIFFVVLKKKKKNVPLKSFSQTTTTSAPLPTKSSTPLWSLSVGAPVSPVTGIASSYLMNVNGILKAVDDNPMLVPTSWIIDPVTGVLTTNGSDGTLLAVKSNSTIVPYVAADSSSYASYDFQQKAVNGINTSESALLSMIGIGPSYPNVFANKIQ